MYYPGPGGKKKYVPLCTNVATILNRSGMKLSCNDNGNGKSRRRNFAVFWCVVSWRLLRRCVDCCLAMWRVRGLTAPHPPIRPWGPSEGSTPTWRSSVTPTWPCMYSHDFTPCGETDGWREDQDSGSRIQDSCSVTCTRRKGTFITCPVIAALKDPSSNCLRHSRSRRWLKPTDAFVPNDLAGHAAHTRRLKASTFWVELARVRSYRQFSCSCSSSIRERRSTPGWDLSSWCLTQGTCGCIKQGNVSETTEFAVSFAASWTTVWSVCCCFKKSSLKVCSREKGRS